MSWDVLIALILGVVEGLTEFAPVSSTGHMILVDELLLQNGQVMIPNEIITTFKVVIQLGSILAVIVIFWRRILRLLGLGVSEDQPHFSFMHVFLGVLPAMILGLLLDHYLDQLFTIQVVLMGLIFGGVLMVIAEKIPTKITTVDLDQVTYRQAFGIGLFQCLALWPGFSRSGSTISGGLLLGANHHTSSEFSFLVAFPIMLGASSLRLYKSWDLLSVDYLPYFMVGFITAFIVALLAIRFFLNLIDRIKLTPFAIYRFLLAGIIYLLFI